MATTIIYPGFDNEIRKLLKIDGAAYGDLSNVIRMELALTTGQVISSDNGSTDPIQWSQSGYATGEIRVFLGLINPVLSQGSYRGYLSIYSPLYPDGYIWGAVNFNAITVAKGAD